MGETLSNYPISAGHRTRGDYVGVISKSLCGHSGYMRVALGHVWDHFGHLRVTRAHFNGELQLDPLP